MEVGVEINNAITSVPLSGDMIDDDELEAEMNDLEQELVDNKMLSAPAAPVTATPGMANGRGELLLLPTIISHHHFLAN